jgi:hypothetical protein
MNPGVIAITIISGTAAVIAVLIALLLPAVQQALATISGTEVVGEF